LEGFRTFSDQSHQYRPQHEYINGENGLSAATY
jgi:hypothetical protein